MLIVLAVILPIFMPTGASYGLKVDSSGDQWTIHITGGSENAKDVTLRILDTRNGVTVYNSSVNALDGSIAAFYDINSNGKLDSGDGIALMGDSIITAGMKVQLLKGDKVLGTINSLSELSGGTVVTCLGLRTERTSNDDWLITITGGSQLATSVTIRVLDPITGVPLTTTLATPGQYSFVITPNVPNWGAAANTTCGIWNDNNGNGKIDAGDSILLYMLSGAHPNGKDLTGMKVQFMKGVDIIGAIGELPG
jgi:hypothetical protein